MAAKYVQKAGMHAKGRRGFRRNVLRRFPIYGRMHPGMPTTTREKRKSGRKSGHAPRIDVVSVWLWGQYLERITTSFGVTYKSLAGRD